jgi:hypothetical protein
MQGGIEILAGARAADGGALQDEQRDRQQGDRGHFLVHILRHRIERGAGHEGDHEQYRHGAQCEGDRQPDEQGEQGGAAIEQS